MTIKEEYRRERRRLNQYVRRARSRGLLTKEGEDLSTLIPEIPKRVTAASVRRLKRITPDKILSRAELVDTDTGEVITGARQIRSYERSRAAAKAAETRYRRAAWSEGRAEAPGRSFDASMIFNNLVADLRQMGSGVIAPWLDALYRARDTVGLEKTAHIIEDNATVINDLVRRYTGAYQEEIIVAGIGEFGYLFLTPLYERADDRQQAYEELASKWGYDWGAF